MLVIHPAIPGVIRQMKPDKARDLTDEEWNLLPKILALLVIFDDATHRLSAIDCDLSAAAVIILTLGEQLEALKPVRTAPLCVRQVWDKLDEGYREKFSPLLTHTGILAVALVMHPPNKRHLDRLFDEREENQLWQHVTSLCQTACDKEYCAVPPDPVPVHSHPSLANQPPPRPHTSNTRRGSGNRAAPDRTTTNDASRGQHVPQRSLAAEVQEYRYDRTGHNATTPLAFWADAGATFPRVRKLALHILSIQATSTSAERAFSRAGRLFPKSRASTGHTYLQDILKISHNDPTIVQNRAARSEAKLAGERKTIEQRKLFVEALIRGEYRSQPGPGGDDDSSESEPE